MFSFFDVMALRRWMGVLLVMGFMWGLMLINLTIVNNTVERESEKMQDEILVMSERYVKLLAKDTVNTIDGPYAARLTGYDLKKTLAVLLNTMMDRIDVLERQVQLLTNSTRLPALPLQADVRNGEAVFPAVGVGRLHGPSQDKVGAVAGRIDAVGPNNTSRQLLESQGDGDANLDPRESVVKIQNVNAKELLLGIQEDCSIKEADKIRFPHCTGKVEWMQTHWRSDECYAGYGVDGSLCSFRMYLSEVESWCPLIPGRHVKFTNTTGVEMASVNLKIDGLMSLLQDPGQRHNYAWMRMRIKRLWPRWTEGAKHLMAKNALSDMKRKRIVVHMGLLTRASGWKIAENSFRGGPLGELVQWSDIISALYILGHDIHVTSEVEQLQAHMNKMGKKTQSCPTQDSNMKSKPNLLYTDLKGLQQLKRVVKAGIGQYRAIALLPNANTMCMVIDRLPIDLVYTDLIGLKHFQRLVNEGFGKFSCMLRIIDSFGTEPSFNHGPYAKAHRMKTGWGMQGLNPLQFYTMFPHSPDNSFMGFVVETHVNDTIVKNLPRLNQALVYGKAENMWKDKKEYLDIIHERVDIHSTVYLDDGGANIIPSYVINHGILSGFDLHKLLRKSKIFIGLGFPYEGPAPLEAIAQGCVYINPKFKTPHSSANTAFFKGKPTLRKLPSQHPYAEQFIGEPHVFTVDITDKDQLREVISQALNASNEGLVKPYLPYEYTEEGMLERLNIQVQHQDFCNPYSEIWPPEEAVEVILGPKGQSCKDVCDEKGLICEPTHFPRINTKDMLGEYIGKSCGSVSELEEIYFPAYHQSQNQCLTQKESLLFSCVGDHEDLKRLCPCRDFIPGQTALCSTCH